MVFFLLFSTRLCVLCVYFAPTLLTHITHTPHITFDRVWRLQSKRADTVIVVTPQTTIENVHADTQVVYEDDDDDLTSLKEIEVGEPCVNDSQVITQIVEQYEQRLQAQLALAKQDIVNALEVQIQVGPGWRLVLFWLYIFLLVLCSIVNSLNCLK